MSEPNGTIAYRVSELEQDVRALDKRLEERFEVANRKVDRLTWALVTLTLSIAGSAVIFAVTVLTLKGRA
jgi:hypothetical protein